MKARVVVIGGGAFGASCFYHLTAKGIHDVVLVEQATLGSGSTGRSAAVVETQYLAPDQVALCAWSIRVFQRLEREHALPFVHHGYLRLGHASADVSGFDQSVALQRSHGLTDARVIGPDEIARIVPALRVDDVIGALWGPSDGYVDAVRYCEILAGLGRAAGGKFLQGRRATGLRLRGGRVAAVEVDGESIECETVVNASGAWARRLGGALGLSLPVDGYRRQLVQFEPPRPLAAPVPMVIDYVPGVERRGPLLPGRHAGPDRRRPPLGGARGRRAPRRSGRVPSGGRLGLRGASRGDPRGPLPGRRRLPRDRRLGGALPAHARHAPHRRPDARASTGSTRPSGAAASGSRSRQRSGRSSRTWSRRARPR